MTKSFIECKPSIDRIVAHVKHMYTQTPFRRSGSGVDVDAGRYIVRQMTEYGLEAELQEFETFDSDPGEATLVVHGSESLGIPARACAHVEATSPDGLRAEIVDVGPGGVSDYGGLDVRGKIVLAEVSYAPATPEKARIAAANGAAGIILMNWGRDDGEDIPWRGLKAVWGNPTPETWEQIPRLVGLSISRKHGLALRKLMARGSIEAFATVSSERIWRPLSQPIAWLRAANGPERDKFVIVSGHIDSWLPGATDNITGNATMLEIARVLAARREQLRRSVVFCFWNGHEVAEASGSTYFVDSMWERINRDAVAYLNIDSVGMAGTSEFHINSAPELEAFSLSVALDCMPRDMKLRVRSLDRFGDQSFFGVGVSATTARHGFPQRIVEELHGATIGWYNHTEHDTLEVIDEKVLKLDANYWTRLIARLVFDQTLPQRLTPRVEDLQRRFAAVFEGKASIPELGGIDEVLDGLAEQVRWFDRYLETLAADNSEAHPTRLSANELTMRVARSLIFIANSACGKYEQDSYGISSLAYPVPMLAVVEEYRRLNPDSLAAKLLRTRLMRLRHQITDALHAAGESLRTLRMLVQAQDRPKT